MKYLATIAAGLLLLAGLAAAASIDGTWVSQRTVDRGGESFTITQTFELKAQGNTLTGTVSMAFGDREPRPIEIKEGKIDGNKFSFVTVMSTPNGEFKMTYEGTVEGSTLKGTASREGGEPRPFEAKKK